MCKITVCDCKCGAATTDPRADGWHAISKADRGGRVAYVCPSCAAGMGDRSYSTDNRKLRGRAGVGGDFTYSIEFECHNVTPTLRAELQSYGWLPTHDCTTDVEFKSPIFQNLKPLPKKLRTIERLLSNGYGCLTSNDGTHMHVGHSQHIDGYTMSYVRDYYARLFLPLCRAMQAHPVETAALYGRDFTGYACPIDSRTSPWNHCSFVNVSHDETIEFRLCKFHTAEQYGALLKLHKSMVSAIINNFLAYIGDGSTALDHKANVTAGKLVRLYERAAGLR